MNAQFGDLPRDWHISLQHAATVYGDAFLAAVLEAPPSDPLFDAVVRLLERAGDLVEAFGLVPDVNAVLVMTDLDHDALVQALDIPPSMAQDYASGSVPLPCGAAVTLCRTYYWPLGVFFRDSRGYHPETALHRDLGW